jgi:hypothetical protein
VCCSRLPMRLCAAQDVRRACPCWDARHDMHGSGRQVLMSRLPARGSPSQKAQCGIPKPHKFLYMIISFIIYEVGMHEQLWAGVDRKLQGALFYFIEMGRSLESAIWQESFYAHVDTFLAKVRSVPEVIESCFGADRVLIPTEWFGQLPDDEQKRRKTFSTRFRNAREKFLSIISPTSEISASTDLATPASRAR